MKKNKGYGLNPTPEDRRDFPNVPVFGFASPAELPDTYTVSTPLIIKDQTDTDMCSAFALTAVSEDQERVALDPAYTFFKTKQIMGGDVDSWGADLRSACKSSTRKYGGFLPMSRYGGNVPVFNSVARDRAARGDDFKNTDDWVAKKYSKQTYFAVVGERDAFDNMKSALWRTRDEERSIFTGIDWNPLWNRAKLGRVEKVTDGQTYGHAVKMFGWELEDWGVFQLSNGKEIGDGGIFTLHRDVINRFCTYGSFTVMDLPRDVAEYEMGRIGTLRYWWKSIFA